MIKHTRVQHYRLFTCEVCGHGFRSSRQHARTCSPTCRKKLSRAGQAKKKNDTSKNVPLVTFQQLDLLVKKHVTKFSEIG